MWKDRPQKKREAPVDSEKQKETGHSAPQRPSQRSVNCWSQENDDIKNLSTKRQVFGFHDFSSLVYQGFSQSILSGTILCHLGLPCISQDI